MRTNSIVLFWRRRSLKFWLYTGMIMAVVPLGLSSGAGYYIYLHYITKPLVSAIDTHRAILRPLQELQLTLWDVVGVVNSTLTETGSNGMPRIEQKADEIIGEFDRLASLSAVYGIDADTIRSARKDWAEVFRLARAILREPSPLPRSAALERRRIFEDRIDDIAHQLSELYDDTRIENEKIHNDALGAFRLSEELVLAAFGLSVVFVIFGVFVINRSLVTSTDELSSAALRLASGDKEYRVKVLIPQELANVAAAFNLMREQIRQQQEALEQAASIDDLTGLLNRREFDRLLREEVARCRRYQTPTALIMIDIDLFKNFNDSYGHQGGDEALRTVSQAIRNSVRDIDRVCRFGGEEIAVILPAADRQSAVRAAERIRQAVAERKISVTGDRQASVTISLGVATCRDRDNTADALLRAADSALYLSKEQGRNRVTLANPVTPGTTA